MRNEAMQELETSELMILEVGGGGVKFKPFPHVRVTFFFQTPSS